MPSRIVKNNLRKRLVEADKTLRKELKKVAQDTARVLKRDHERVVANWSHKVKFGYIYQVDKNLISANIYAYGANRHIWFFVNDGTKPHIIRPKRAKFLKFRTGYSPRTARGGFGGPGTSSGPWVSAAQVRHPGSAARNFTADISKRAAPRFRRETEKAFRKAIRR